uniref:Putative Erf family protein n=2 Tax=viral metagenome TaxID=1070528 RepID=A0A6M3JTG7_9ZZZZ
MRSDSTKEIATALSNFQGKMTAVKKDSVNPFYKSKYASLDTIWETIRKPLSENGLSVAQTMNLIEDKSVLETTLYHTSGEWISGTQLVNPVKDDPQSLGSAISYARRYSLSAILGLVSDDDDDANTATKPETKQEVKAPEKPVPPTVETPQKSEGITLPQTKKIHATAKDKGLSPEEARAYMQKTFKKNSTKELTKEEASTMIEFLNEIKPDDIPLVRAAKEMGAKEE